jgi:hypothetical protein
MRYHRLTCGYEVVVAPSITGPPAAALKPIERR